MFRFITSKHVLFECEARVHSLNLKRLQLISESSAVGSFFAVLSCRHKKVPDFIEINIFNIKNRIGKSELPAEFLCFITKDNVP